MPDLDRNLQPIIKETPQEGNFMGPFPPSLGVGGGLYQYPDAAKADISATDRLAELSRQASPDLREIYITNQTLAENQRYKSFNPTTEDYEDFAAYGQSWGDKAANGILKGLNLAATTVAGGFGMLGGIGLWATGGKFSDIWDNQFLREIDKWNQEVDNKYLPNYYTRAERDASVWSPTNWFKANFLFDKLIKNAGFAVGAMIGGNIANAGLLRLGAVLGEGAAYLSTATTAFKPFSQLMRATARAFSAGKNIEAAAILEKEISSIADITRNASAIKKIAQQTNNYFKFSDGARRIGVAAYSSAGEAAFEAIQTVNEYKDTLIKKYVEENGEEPTGKALQEIQKEVDAVGARSFLGNLAILGATEWAQLPYLMGSTFKGSRHTANSVMGKVDDVIMENGKWVTKQRIPTKFGKILDKARGVGIYLFDPKESIQEMGQYALQVGVQNYFDKAKLTNAADFWVDGITYGLFGRDEFGEGKGAFVSKEGVESGILGALTGGLMQARGHYLEQRAITKNNSVFAEELNNAPTFKEAFKERLAAINRGVILQQQEQDAVLNGDELEAKDLKTDAFINYLMPRIKFGRFDMVMDDLETLKLITATEEGLAEIRAQGMANLSDSISEYHERLDKLGRFANTINDLYSSLNLRYAGETLKDKDGEEVLVEGKPVRKYSDRAIDKLVYAATKVADYDYRIPSLTGRLLSKGIDVSEILTEIINEDTPNIEATKVALEKINQLSSPEDKISLKRDLIDVMELSLRRNFYLQEYEAIKTYPDIYDKFDVAYSRETEPVEVSQGRGKAKKTLDVKKPYFIDEVLYKDGTTLTLGPQIEVMDETLGGEFQVKLPNGKVAFLTPEEFRSFKLVDTPVAPAGVERILDEVIEEVMNRPKYKGIPKSPKENKLEYINSLGNQKLVNDIKKTFNDRAEKFIREEREKQAKREALIKEQENIKKQQAEIELKSGEETVPTDITGEEREIEGAKKPTETYFKSTISQSEGSEDENWQEYLTTEVPPHIMRARVFLNDAKFLKDKKGNPLRSRLKVIFVTPNNVEGLGLKGLIQLSYRQSDNTKVEEIENALDVEKGFMAAVFVEQDGDRLYFVNEKGERIGKVGTKIDINKVVFQTMPTTSTLTSKNTPRARKGEEELFIEYAKAWKKVREKEFNTPAREVVAHPFGISRGIPIIEYEDATRKTSKKHHVSSSLVSEEIISSQEDLLRISTTGEIFNDPVEGEGRGIRFKKGFTVLKYFDTVEAVYNNKLGEKRAKSVYMVIKALAQELQEKKTINAAYAEFLQTILYWKKSATTKNNQIYIDENTAEIHIAGKAFSITDIVNKEAEIVNILKDVHHHVNNKTLKDNFHSKYYEYVDDMDNPVEWMNYQTYLLSSKDAGGKPREVASTPLVTQVKPPTAATPYSFAQKYAVIGEVDLPIVAPKAEPKTRPVPKQPSKKTETKDKMTYPKGDIFYTSTPNKEGSIDITVEDQETIRLYARDENFIESVLKSLRTIKEYEEQLDNIEQRRDSSVGESLEAVNAEIAILFFANRIKADIVKNQPQQTEKTTEEETEEAELEETVEETPPVVEEEEIQNQEPPDEIDPKKIKPREDDIDASVVGAEERGRVYEALTEEDISRFKEWAAKTIPNFPIQILENLIQIAPDRMAWGVFENNVIKFYKHAKKGTEFHEAFEAVWGTFLTVDERAAILDEERFSGKEFKEVASGKMIEASEATDKQLKEKIADDFAAFMKGKLPARTLSEKIRQFFKNLIDFIKTFIHKPSRKTELFEAINKGKFSKLPLLKTPSTKTRIINRENSLFGVDIQNQKALEFHISTINVVSQFLENIGIEQRLVPQFLSQDGTVIEGALAAANFIEGTVDIIDDLDRGRAEAWNKLPEEAAHWWYRLLKTNSPLKKALWESHQTALKADELYKGQYGKLVSKAEDLTEESIGQLIAEAIKRIETKNANASDYSFFKAFLEWINSIIDAFRNIGVDPFEVAAMKILSSDMSDIMTWEEYRKINNIVNFTETLAEQSVAPIDYTLIEDVVDYSVQWVEYGENIVPEYILQLKGEEVPVLDRLVFNSQEEMDSYVYSNFGELHDRRQKLKIQEVRDSQLFFDRLLNKSFRKKSKYLTKTLKKYFNIIDSTKLNPLWNWNIEVGEKSITKTLSKKEKELIIKTNGYTNITPTLRVLPDLLKKYKKNPIVLSESIKVDGAKKQELFILNNIKEMIRLENPNLKSISVEEFVAETHNWLKVNYLLGFANELNWLDYRVSDTFEFYPKNIKHNKISIRFNDRYHIKSGHFNLSPSAWGNLTYFYSGRNGLGGLKDAVLLHEIQNDNIEHLREVATKEVNLETAINTYLYELSRNLVENIHILENNTRKIVKSTISEIPFPHHKFLHSLLNMYEHLGVEQGLQFLKENLNESILIYEGLDSIYNKPHLAEKEINDAYSEKQKFQNFQRKGGIKSILTEKDINDLKELLHRINTEEVEYDYDEQVGYVRSRQEKSKEFIKSIGELQFKINREFKNLYGDSAPTITLVAPFKTLTRAQRDGIEDSKYQPLNESVPFLIAFSEKQILNRLSQRIQLAKTSYLQAIKATNAYNFNVSLSKITLEQYTTLIENYKHNKELLNRLVDEQAQKELQKTEKDVSFLNLIKDFPRAKRGGGWMVNLDQSGIPKELRHVYINDTSKEDLLNNIIKDFNKWKEENDITSDKEAILFIQNSEFEDLKQEALYKKTKLEEQYEKLQEEVKQILEVEMNYITPLIHHLIQKHISQYGKDVPMYFSGYQITQLTQGNNRTALIYAGKEEIDIVDKNNFEIFTQRFKTNIGGFDYLVEEKGYQRRISKQEYEKAYQQATERRAKEIKWKAARGLGLLEDNPNANTKEKLLSNEELEQGIKKLAEYKKQSKVNLDRVINAIMRISENKPIETGAIYNAMSQISDIKLIWQDKIEGLKNNVGGYLVDLSEYNYNTPILYGLSDKPSEASQSETPRLSERYANMITQDMFVLASGIIFGEQKESLYNLVGITSESIFNRIKAVYVKSGLYDQLGEDRWVLLVQRTKDMLRSLGINFNEEDLLSINDEETTNRNYAPEPFTTDIKKGSSIAIKALLYTLPQTVGAWKKGSLPKRKVSELQGYLTVDFSKAFATLLRRFSNITDIKEFEDTFVELINEDGDYVRLFTRLGGVLETDDAHPAPYFDFESFREIDWKLFIDFFQTFTKQRPEFLIQYTTGLESFTHPAEFASAIELFKRNWIEALKRMAEEKNSAIKYNKSTKTYSFIKPDWYPKAVPTTIDGKLDFLRMIGIDITREQFSKFKSTSKEGQKSEQAKFSDAVTSLYEYLQNVKDIATISNRTIQVGGAINNIAEILVRATNPNEEITRINIEGNKTQNYDENNPISLFRNVFNKIKSLLELKEERPELNDVFSTNSVKLQAGGRFFNTDGKRIGKHPLRLVIVDAKYDRGVRKGSTIAKMGFGDRLTTEINQNLQGIYYTLIPADSSREWALNLGNEIDYTDIVAGKRGINKITKIFRGYLEDDIRLALDYKNRSKLAAISEDKGKRLRFFEDILSYREENGNVVKTKLLLSIEKMINENKPFEDIMEMINQEDNLRQVNESIIEYITEDAQGLLASLRQLNKIVIHNEKGKRNQTKEQTEVLYEFKELLDEFVENNKLTKTKLTMEQLENIGLFLSANYIINNIEYHKMFFGDPFQFQEKKGKLDEIKRIKSFLSPRRFTFDHPIFRNFANSFYNKVDSIVLNEKEIGRHTFKPYLRTITLKDIPMASQIYGRVDKETDGFSVLMDNGYREVRIRNRQWTEKAEQWHQWQMAYTRQHVPNYKYKTKGLEEHDKELLKTPEPEFTIEVLKPIVAGNKANSTHINLVLDKFSQMPLYYKAVEGTELGNLYLKLFEAEVDYGVFESGRKVGSEETYDLYKDGELNPDAPINFIDVPWNAYGIQVETMHENEFFQTRGSQLTKMASQDLFEGGEPIGDTPERKAAVQKAYDDNIKALNLYHEHAYKHLLDKLGIEDMGTHYRLVSPASVERLLSDEMFRRLLPENAKATIRRNPNGDFRIPFESSPYYQQIRDIIFASLNKALVSPVMTGNPSVQVPVSLWEASGKGRGMMRLINNVWTKITIEEYNTLSEEEKKKVAFTSDTLKFYTKEDPYCEIMIPHWFKDLFQGKSDKEILKYLNSTPEGKKILRGIGFRIPTQSLASVETFRVKGFLPAFMGNTVVVPSEIVAKTNSDFDIDKLNLYLKSIHLDANEKVRLTRFLGTEERTVKYFEDLYNQIIYEKIAKIEKFNDFRKNLLSFFEKGKEIQLAQLNKESEVPEFTEEEIEFLEKYRPLLQNIIDEAWADGQRHPSEYIKDQIEKLQDAAEEQRLKLFNELMREKFVQRHFRRALENNYYETLEKLLTLPESFERRMQPVDNAGLDKLAEEVQNLRNEGEFSIRNRILNRMFMTKQRHAFLSGKKWVGIAATNVTGHIIFQKGKVYIDVDRIKGLSKFERGFIRDGKIALPHNTLLVDGKEVVSLSGRLTADGSNQFISDRISGYTTAFVDVANDPYILNLIYSDNVVGTTLFLERIGAGETGLLFMNQPIIIEYLKMLEQQGARGLFGKNNLKNIRNKFGGNTVKSAKSFSIESFKDNIKTYHSGKPLSKQQLAEQLAIFDEFLKYSKMGEHLFRLSQAMNFDTTKFRSADNFYRKRTKTDIAKSGNIFSGVEDVLNNTHIGFQAEMLSKAMASLQAIFKMEHPEIRSILNEMLLPYINELYLSNDKFEKVANRLRTSLLDYIILTKSNLYKEIEDLLVNPKTSVANRLIAAKKKYPQFEILYHLFTETGKRGDETKNTKTLKLDVPPDNPMENNLYVGAMRELKQYLPNLYNDIVKLAILQGGSRSPVSIKTIIPVEDYAAIITPLLEQVKHRKDIEGFLEGWFQRNNFRDPDIAPDPDLYFDLVRDGSGFSIDTGPIEKGYEILSYISKAYERANPLLKKLGRKPSSREILLLSEEYHEKVVKYDVVVVPRVVRSKRTGELVSIVTGQTVTPPMMAEAFNKGDYTYYDVVGYKRVVDPVSKTPIITPEGEYIYRMINLYGDGHLASEYYPNFQKSVLENGTRKVEKELTDAEIIKALGSEVDISPDNTQEAEVIEAPKTKALPAKTVPEKEGNVLWSTVKNIYEQLPQSTKDPESNVVIEDNFKEAQQKHREGKGIYSLRANFNINSPIVNLTTKHHFGNPYSSNPDALQKDKSLIRTKSTRDSVEKYINWVLNHSNERAQWIREQLKSGKLKGKVIYYYKELGEPSHAIALDYLINKYDWGTTPTEETVPIEPIPEDTSGLSAFTNHSGGAVGADSLWDEIGRTFGFKNHKHYHAKGEKTPKGNVAISIEELKQADEHLKKANETLGRKFPSTKSFVNNLLRRNYWQVKNAEAIYAIGNLTESEIGEDIVEGGTGWAVQMAIDLGKPVYLFDITDESWYSNIPGEGWQNMEEAPILTKNYAGIGSRLKNTPAEKIEIVKKAITEVYSKTVATFEQVEEQQPISPSEAPVIAPKIEAYYNSLSREEQEKLGTLEDVLYLYMEIPFLYDEDQFIDELKCKK